MKTWRDFDKEINHKNFQELEKFLIYVEFEFLVKLKDETLDELLNILNEVRQNTDYCTATGIGMATHNWLYGVAEKLGFDIGDATDKQFELLDLYISGAPEDFIYNEIKEEWRWGDWS